MDFSAPSFPTPPDWQQNNLTGEKLTWDYTNYQPNPNTQALQAAMNAQQVVQLTPTYSRANEWYNPPAPYAQAPAAAWNNQVTGVEHQHTIEPAPLLGAYPAIDAPPVLYKLSGTAFTAAGLYGIDNAANPPPTPEVDVLFLSAPSINGGE